jgi:hypothetical protein
MMYYLISFLLYFLILFLIVITFRKPHKDENRKFKKVFIQEMMKGLSKSDVRSRKKRVKVLPLYQRILYWLWFTSVMTLIFLPMIVLSIARYYILEFFFIPDHAFNIDFNTPSLLVFGVGVFLAGIALAVAYSYLTNRGIIREADMLYQLGSFQEYPKKANVFISGILLAVGLPLMILGFNSCRYFTHDEIVVKSALSINEKTYLFSDVEYIKHSLYVDDTTSYTFVIKNGKSITLFEDITINPEFMETIADHNIEIKTVRVKPLWQ